MIPKGKGGKSKAGEAPPSGGEVKTFQTRSSKAGLQVCLQRATAASADGVGWWRCTRHVVPRIHQYLKQRAQNNVRISARAAVYAAAILNTSRPCWNWQVRRSFWRLS